jgi:integrase
MARKTSAKNTKEPVRLREKELANGVRSLYLDIYVNGKRSYEFLKLYLIPETNPQAKVQNENTMRAANTIKLNRILEITNNKAGLKNTSIRAKMLLKDWMETFRQAQEQKGVKDQKLIHNTVHALTAYNIKVAMRDVNRDYIIGLTNFLRNDYRSPRGKKLKDYSVINYLGCLRNALNMAVREDVIADNPIMKLSAQDKVKAPESQREFLTIEEVQQLEATDSPYPHIKQAFLFACYTGLRCSDVRSITWGKIVKDGEKYRLHTVMFKTKRPFYIPLSKKAMQWMPERGDKTDDDLIFENIPVQVNTKLYLQPWLDKAGITKPITFHCSRHTFGTMMLTLGADIYTTSKLMGHTKVEVTQIYAKIINKKKDDAVSLIDQAFA